MLEFCAYNACVITTSIINIPLYIRTTPSWLRGIRNLRLGNRNSEAVIRIVDQVQTYRRLKNNTVTLGTIRLAMDHGPPSRCLPLTRRESLFGLPLASSTVFEGTLANHHTSPTRALCVSSSALQRDPHHAITLRTRHFQSIG